MRVIVTGGAGFIGSALIRHLIGATEYEVLNFDKLTYAGNLESLTEIESNPRYHFMKGDITDASVVRSAMAEFQPMGIIHLAAESHVDRSIDAPADFINTNILGTYRLLESSHEYWRALPEDKKKSFRFHHVSTDEVFGSLGATGLFTEKTSYQPNSPYSASKASSDHLVRSWFHTFGFPVVTTNCSNNYGPYQFPEKLIPLCFLKALSGEKIPVYGKGENIRDWLYVQDHVEALLLVYEKGRLGETYNIGGDSEKRNIDVVKEICQIMDDLKPSSTPHENLVSFVEDRPGHDLRYAMDASKLESELGWKPKETFSSGLRKTLEWYLSNQPWWKNILDKKYQGERLGFLSENRK